MRLVLHLASPPTDKLLLSPSAEACKQAFMGQMKEADFIRWGNTKRMTGLRKAEQDGLWEGIREREWHGHDMHRRLLSSCPADNFEEYWRVASKVTPTTTPTRPQSPPPGNSTSLHSRPPSVDPNTGSAPDRDGAYNVRSVPVRIYLPEGPILQDLVPPTLEDGAYTDISFECHSYLSDIMPGNPHTLGQFLRTHLPLLFPPTPNDPPFQDLAYPIVQGVAAPLDAEMAWLGACMAGADGWLNVCVGLLRDR